MSAAVSTQLLDVISGAILLTAVLTLWRRDLAAIVRLLMIQGVLIAGLALLLGVTEKSGELYLVCSRGTDSQGRRAPRDLASSSCR